MRTIGPGTQAAIDSQIYQRDVILYVYSEDDTPVETAIPMDCLIEIPRVQTTLDQVTWRMTAQIVQTDTTAALIARGRRIVAKEYLADGEPMLLFDGHIADVDESKDWSTGAYRASWTVECAGRLAKALDTDLQRFRQEHGAPYYPDNLGEQHRSKLTGIVKRVRSGKITVGTVGTAIQLPGMGMPFFGSNNLNTWVGVYDESLNLVSGSTWNVTRDAASGLFYLTFSTNPGTTYFYVDMMVVDCWVLLNRRAGSWLANVPYYQVLSGTEGVGSYERLGDPGTTIVTVGYSLTSFKVKDPMGLFASGDATYGNRYLSIWHGDPAVEYRAKIASVDKTPGATYGLVGLAAAPVSSSGATIPMINYDLVENTTTQHYQICDPSYRVKGSTWDGSWWPRYDAQLIPDYHGRYYFGRKGWQEGDQPIFVMPGYNQDLSTQPDRWYFYASVNAYDAPHLSNINDAVQSLVYSSSSGPGLLPAIGITSIEYEDTGLFLAPFSRSQTKALDILSEVRKNVLPPNFLVYEEAASSNTWTTYLKYVQQVSTPCLILQGVQGIKPRELPAQITRCYVDGSASTIDRAGQLFNSASGIDTPSLLFLGMRADGTARAKITGNLATVKFGIPMSEAGRYPNIRKIIVRVTNRVTVDISASDQAGGSVRYLPRSPIQNESRNKITEHVWEDIEFAIPSMNGACILIMEFIADSLDEIDSIEIHMNTGAYWDAQLTDDTNLAPADGPDGVNGFGANWYRPDATKFESYRYAPTAWLRRNAASWTSTLKAHRVQRQTIEGIGQGQSQEVAQSYCDQAIRSYEFEEITCSYDPRISLGDTIGIPQEDGSIKNRLVWGINKGPKDMQLTVADYSK